MGAGVFRILNGLVAAMFLPGPVMGSPHPQNEGAHALSASSRLCLRVSPLLKDTWIYFNCCMIVKIVIKNLIRRR